MSTYKKGAINFKDFIDTTLRDGQESPLLFDTYKYYFSLEEKKQIIQGLIKLGVRHIELFSPVVSEAEAKDFLKIRKYVKSISPKKTFLLAHSRCRQEDIDLAMKAGFDGLNLFMGLSKNAQKYSHGKNLNELTSLIKTTIISTRKKYPKAYLRYSAEDAFRTPLKNIYQVYDQIYQYVDTLGMPDTTGIATPSLVKQRIKALKRRYPKVNLESHFHNDRGYALVNTVTAIENGLEYVDSSIWGLAERSGIASITGVLLNLYNRDKNYVKNYEIYLCYPLNVLMGSILKIQVPFTEPVSLTNRTHIGGVHQKGLLNNKKTYEAHGLEKFGVTKRQLLLGPLTGWNFIYYYLKEVEGFVVSQEQAQAITKKFKKQVSEISEKIKPEDLLMKIVKKHPLVKITVPEKYRGKRIENLS